MNARDGKFIFAMLVLLSMHACIVEARHAKTLCDRQEMCCR